MYVCSTRLLTNAIAKFYYCSKAEMEERRRREEEERKRREEEERIKREREEEAERKRREQEEKDRELQVRMYVYVYYLVIEYLIIIQKSHVVNLNF